MPQPTDVSKSKPLRFELSWRNGFGYRVSVPSLLSEGERISVREDRITAEELDEVARVLHVMGCVKDCDGDPSGWLENAKIIAGILFTGSNDG